MKKYTIGEFSELTGISKRMLRHYDKLALFCPEEVNKENNYRYYCEYQIDHLNKIQFLNALGFSLSSIKDILSKPIGIKEFTELLFEKEVALTKQEDEIKSNLVSIKKLIQVLELETDKIFPSVYKLLDLERSYGMTKQISVDLKGFMTRDMFMEKIEEMMKRDNNDDYHFVMFDIDMFMKVNDTNGYAVGDAVIKQFISIILQTFEPILNDESEVLYTRLGGDEFSLFFKNQSNEIIETMVGNTLQTIEKFDFNTIGCTVDITASAGISKNKKPAHTAKFQDICTRALISAKRSGRNQYKMM